MVKCAFNKKGTCGVFDCLQGFFINIDSHGSAPLSIIGMPDRLDGIIILEVFGFVGDFITVRTALRQVML